MTSRKPASSPKVVNVSPAPAPTRTGQRSILITGCSSGIGLDAAITLKKEGWRVFAACRKREDCERLVQEHGLETCIIDYDDEPTIASGLDQVLKETGGTLDAVFNNGAYGLGAAAEDVSTDALRAIFQTNLFGWHELTRLAIQVMRRQGGYGRIVQCSSILGVIAMPFRMAYCCTKYALEAHCDVLRLELADTRIKVVSLNVGPIRTMIREKSRPRFERWIQPVVEQSPFRSYYEKTMMPRLYGPYKKDTGELEAEAVTDYLRTALLAKNPRPRYSVTWPTYLFVFLKRILPGYLLDWVILRAMGLHPPEKQLHP